MTPDEIIHFGGKPYKAAGRDAAGRVIYSPAVFSETPPVKDRQPKRIRQDTKPLMNPLEQEWFNILKTDSTITHLRAQALKFRIGNNAFYKPDITAMVGTVLHAWECKGRRGMKNQDRGYLALKSAATQWPEVKFILVFKDCGAWKSQEVLA